MATMYRIFKNKWITPPNPVNEEYSGRIIVVTGATSGIGEEAAYKFAALGASKVIIAARDLKKGESTKARLEARLGRKDQFEVWQLDMMSYDSILAFTEQAKRLDHLDIVILNAGTRRTTFNPSPYGWEEDLQVNTLSTVLLALFLLPKLKASKHLSNKIPILEFVNSGLHQSVIVPEDVRKYPKIFAHYNSKSNFAEGAQYSLSKLFLMYATQHLASSTSSADLIITSICPGWVMTNLGRDHYFPGVFILAFFFILLFMRTPSQGADMILSGTIQGESVHGRFWRHDKIQPVSDNLKGSEMKKVGERVWEEILEGLERDVKGLWEVVDEALGGM